MSQKRTTPLESSSLQKHHCTLDIRLDKLGMVPFLKSLVKEEMQQVNKRFSAYHFKAGDVLYYQGVTASLLRVVVYGAVKLTHSTEEGKEILVDMLKPGDYFGSLNELGSESYTETATAQSDVCILSIGNREFRSILIEHPSVAIAVIDIVSDKLNAARERIQHLTTLPVEIRIAHILTRLCEKFGEESNIGTLLQLPLSRKDLADMAGTSTETASRIMSRFQQGGMITSGRQWVSIINERALRDIISDFE